MSESEAMPLPVTPPSRLGRLGDLLLRFARPVLAVYWPLMLYVTQSPESQAVSDTLDPIRSLHPDKWFHFVGYGLLTVLLVHARVLSAKATFAANLTAGCTIAGAYGVIDELLQGLLPFGRTPDGADLTADFWAVCSVYVVLLLLHPSRKATPWGALSARVVFAMFLPLGGVLLFTPGMGANLPSLGVSCPVPLDHVAHFVAAWWLTLLIAAAAPLGVARGAANRRLAVVGMLLLGPAIEGAQGAFFFRGAEWADLLGHSLGVMMAMATWRLKRALLPLPLGEGAALLPLPLGEGGGEGESRHASAIAMASSNEAVGREDKSKSLASPGPHPSPLPEGEGAALLPLPLGEGGGEGRSHQASTVAIASTGDAVGDEDKSNSLAAPGPHSSPLPEGEGAALLPLPLGEGGGEGESRHASAIAMASSNEAVGGEDKSKSLANPGPHPSPLPGGEGAEGHKFVIHAMITAGMTLLSRFTGLVRDSVQAAVLGLTGVADAFSIGFLIPNLFRRLFGEGALTAAFIPIYTSLQPKDPAVARRFAWCCIAAMVVVLSALTLLGEAVLALVDHVGSFAPDTHLALRLTMIMLPYMPMICIVAVIGGILQVHGRFAAPAAAPIFLNIVMIVGTLAAVRIATGDDKLRDAVVIISFTVLIAGLVQLLWQGLMVYRVEPATFDFTGAWPHMKSMLVMMLPMFVGLGVFQINTMLDYFFAFGLSQKEGGAEQLHLVGLTLEYPMTTGDVAALQWAQRLYQFPLGVFGIAVATAIFPALSRAAGGRAEGQRANGQGKEGENMDVASPALRPSALGPSSLGPSPGPSSGPSFRDILHQGLRLTFFIGLPASAGLILLRVPITRLIYERGQFSLEDSQRVAHVMIGYCAVVWAYSMTHVLTRAFFAVKDSTTPLRVSLWMVGLNVVGNLTLIWPMGVAGLAWSSALSAVLQVVLLVRALRKYVDEPVGADVRRSWRMTALLTLAMIVVLLPVTLIWNPLDLSRRASAIQLLILLPIGMAIVLGGAWWMKAEELTWLRRRRRSGNLS